MYHLTSRGDRREDIFLDDEDRQMWMSVLGLVCDRFNWVEQKGADSITGLNVDLRIRLF